MVLATRFNLWHPQLVRANVLTSVAYMPPSAQSPIEKVVEILGYMPFCYQQFFAKPGASEIMAKNVCTYASRKAGHADSAQMDSIMSLLFAADSQKTWREVMCEPGRTEEWVVGNRTGPIAAFFGEEKQRRFKEFFADGFPVQWYVASRTGANAQDEQGELFRS